MNKKNRELNNQIRVLSKEVTVLKELFENTEKSKPHTLWSEFKLHLTDKISRAEESLKILKSMAERGKDDI